MKPLAKHEYLFPVGNECSVPSLLEALIFFAQNELYGTIQLGIAHNNDSDSLCWLIETEEGIFRALKVFNDDNTKPVTGFTPIEINSCFNWKDKFYQLVADEEFALIIKELSCFPTEADAYAYAESFMEHEPLEIYAVKVYRIGKRQEYLYPAWYIVFPQDSGYAVMLLPMFRDDIIRYESIDVNELNWEFIDEGKLFLHDAQFWRLDRNDENGLFFNRMMPPFEFMPN